MRASKTSFPAIVFASLVAGFITFGLPDDQLREARAYLEPTSTLAEWSSPDDLGNGPGHSTVNPDPEVDNSPLGELGADDVEVQRGSADRSAILDALRPSAERKFGAPVEFVVLELRKRGSSAFASVQPQRPGGGIIDCRTSSCDSAPRMDATLQFQDGRWRAVEVQFLEAASGVERDLSRPDQRTVSPLPQSATAPLPIRRPPTLLQAPASSRISQAYPAEAARVRVQGASGYSHQMDGYARLRCQVGFTGRLGRCTVVAEDPVGFGFGAAALSLASEYAFSPATIDGQPVEGWAEIPVEWTGNQ
jgi:hypothetical protein